MRRPHLLYPPLRVVPVPIDRTGSCQSQLDPHRTRVRLPFPQSRMALVGGSAHLELNHPAAARESSSRSRIGCAAVSMPSGYYIALPLRPADPIAEVDGEVATFVGMEFT